MHRLKCYERKSTIQHKRNFFRKIKVCLMFYKTKRFVYQLGIIKFFQVTYLFKSPVKIALFWKSWLYHLWRGNSTPKMGCPVHDPQLNLMEFHHLRVLLLCSASMRLAQGRLKIFDYLCFFFLFQSYSLLTLAGFVHLDFSLPLNRGQSAPNPQLGQYSE